MSRKPAAKKPPVETTEPQAPVAGREMPETHSSPDIGFREGERLMLRVDIPIDEAQPPGHVSNHADCKLDRNQATTLRRIQNELDRSGAKLANGRRVVTGPDALRWILEQIGVASDNA